MKQLDLLNPENVPKGEVIYVQFDPMIRDIIAMIPCKIDERLPWDHVKLVRGLIDLQYWGEAKQEIEVMNEYVQHVWRSCCLRIKELLYPELAGSRTKLAPKMLYIDREIFGVAAGKLLAFECIRNFNALQTIAINKVMLDDTKRYVDQALADGMRMGEIDAAIYVQKMYIGSHYHSVSGVTKWRREYIKRKKTQKPAMELVK